MSLQVNFTTHGKDLRVTYEDILNSSSGNDWALFGYDKGTNDLKVLGTGNGGLEELQEEFVDGKIQYAFARVTDPNSNLNKFVLIGWCGDGVPESKKGLFNTHLSDVARFLKGYHLQINARSEADVTPQQIMKRIDEASASKYSYHKETTKGRDLITPLQSAYKKTEIPDIAAMQRAAPKPEPAPKYSVGSSKPDIPSSSTPVSARWNPAGASSTSTSSSSTSTFSSSTPVKPVTPPKSSTTASWRTGGGSSYVPPTSGSFNRVAPPASLSSYTVERNEPTMNKAAQMRLEREQREREERARIEQEIKDREARERAADQSASASRVAEERRLQEEQERKKAREEEEARERKLKAEEEARQARARDEQERQARERREAEEAEMSARAAREAAKAREQGEIEAARARARKEEEAREAAAAAATAAAESEATAARKRAEEEAEEARRRQRQQQEAEEAEARRRAAEAEASARKQAEEEAAAATAAAAAEEEEAHRRYQEEQERHLQEDMHAAAARSVNAGADALIASSEHPERAAGPQTKTAVVLYSYEAAEANEMSLVEGEILYNVSELDVGWWSGESEDGARSGLFPANYVELIEHAHPDYHEGAAAAEAAAAHEEANHSAAAAVATATPAGGGGGHASDKPTAVALYDYVAGEPNEISFVEGETIVDIEQVTDDWWQGVNHKGESGLFPANYVELHQ
ncbi:hypothetical protein BGZ73_005525 [Actinomortierella ambigua]|nr:hypothetical protein BGZ73_005525 [Actinomortierella ambigua]